MTGRRILLIKTTWRMDSTVIILVHVVPVHIYLRCLLGMLGLWS